MNDLQCSKECCTRAGQSLHEPADRHPAPITEASAPQPCTVHKAAAALHAWLHQALWYELVNAPSTHHFMPVEKPAPPRPRSPDAFTSWMIHCTCSMGWQCSAVCHQLNPGWVTAKHESASRVSAAQPA